MKSAIKKAATLIAVGFCAGQSAQASTPSQATFGAGLSTTSEIANGRSNGSRSDELVAHPEFSQHNLRITANPSLCDPSVKQHSGYLDISDGRHLWFWFFEARESPQDAPLMMWLNGGPGCTSSMGLFFEMGPCTIADEGESTVPNHYSWNKHANLIFLDSPINTGFSYSSDGSKVDTLSDMTVDLYAFLTLFLTRYPEYTSAPFHLAAESWGGHYAPNIGSYIHNKNKELAFAPRAGHQHINLVSLIIVNGLTDPLVQFGSIPEYGCGGAPYPPWYPSGTECATLKHKAPLCTSLIESCYRFPSKATCNPATNYCWYELLTTITITDRNPYDLRVACDANSSTCYPESNWIKRFLNKPSHRDSLGVDAYREFTVCNMTTNGRFYEQGQAMRNSAALLPELINDGIRLLVMAGDTDWICNYIGVQHWMQRLEHNYHPEFAIAPARRWKTTESGLVGGEVRSAGPGAGNVTFVQVYDAGHMAPHDQPEVTEDVIVHWLKNLPFYKH